MIPSKPVASFLEFYINFGCSNGTMVRTPEQFNHIEFPRHPDFQEAAIHVIEYGAVEALKLSQEDQHILDWSKKRLQDQMNLNLQECLNAYSTKEKKLCEDKLSNLQATNKTDLADLTQRNQELAKALDRFCTLSNGLSFYFRSPDENVALRTQFKDLAEKLQVLYDHQCNVEASMDREK